MKEIIFVIEESNEGGFEAHALGESIYTDGDTIEELKENIIDAIKCHFDEVEIPKILHLHHVRQETLAI